MGNVFSHKPQIETPNIATDTLGVIRETRKKYLLCSHTEKIDGNREDVNIIQPCDNLDAARINNSKDLEDEMSTTIDLEMYKFPFENIVFEGGGSKGLAYCGAIKRLEELGIMKQIKRFAGTSAGAMTAALLAIGYNSHDLEEFFKLNLKDLLLDHSWGFLSFVPNLLKIYGWNPGDRITSWFGEKMKEKTGKEDITFKEVYDIFGCELCIVVTDVNQMTPLYCHPKTTPDIPVRLAVRMSLSIPGLFAAVQHTMYGRADYFVDGGVLCNYPIHCFDGWWLSMKKEDNFFERLQPIENVSRLYDRAERFGQYNDKTFGMQVYSDNEPDLLKYQLENLRPGLQLNSLPETKLAKAKKKMEHYEEQKRMIQAMNAFLASLKEHDTDNNDMISRRELLAALSDEKLFPPSEKKIIFGDVDSETIWKCLDKDGNDQIKFYELVKFIEDSDINMHYRFIGYERRNIESFPKFLSSLYETLTTNVDRVYIQEKDLHRTVGINTGYVGTTDFELEKGDVEFLCERGRLSLETFLKSYVALDKERKRLEGPMISSTDGVSSPGKPPAAPSIPSP